MCAIAGLVGPSARVETLARMLAVMRHRGDPEHGHELFAAEGVALGANRLAIMDPTHGKQPFLSPSGSIVCVMNGEIYNWSDIHRELKHRYDFRTACDTEVALAAYIVWGDRFTEHFEGQYAIAIVDSNAKRLALARDPLGITPLCYSIVDDSVWFASEYKALAQFDRIREIIDVSPGECYANNASHRAFVLPRFSRNGRPAVAKERRFSDAAALLRDEVTAAVGRRLGDGERPTACLLSGGIDSSTVTVIAHRMNPRGAEAFTLASGEGRSDDLKAAQLTCARHEIPLNVVRVPASELQAFYLSHGVALAETFEPPLVRNSVAYHFVCRAVRAAGYKYCLSGEGADEIFGGYQYFKQVEEPQRSELVNGAVVDLHRTYLRMADRASMYASVEVRVPFLDFDVVKLAATFPSEWRIRDHVDKRILRSLLPELPKAIRARRKVGMNEGAGFGTNDPHEGIYAAAVRETYARAPESHLRDMALARQFDDEFNIDTQDIEEVYLFARYFELGLTKVASSRTRVQLNTTKLGVQPPNRSRTTERTAEHALEP